MTKKMLKRIVAVMIAACLCLEIFAVQAAESDVFTEDTEFTAVETEEVSVNEQADPELPVLEVLPEDLPELSGEEITEPETPELPVVEVTPETNPEDLPELSVLEEQPEILPETESETDPEEQPQLPVEEEQPEAVPKAGGFEPAPNTGDHSGAGLWLALLLSAAGCAGALAVRKKRG